MSNKLLPDDWLLRGAKAINALQGDGKQQEARTEKRCSKCGLVVPAAQFTKNASEKDGLGRLCKPCKLEHDKEWARKYPEKYNAKKRRQANKVGGYRKHRLRKRVLRPASFKANDLCHKALVSGVLIRPTACSKCGRECKPQAHHEDYSKPLDVTWLCRPCHLAIDGKVARVRMPGDPL